MLRFPGSTERASNMLTMLKIKLFFKKMRLWIKTHWELTVAVIAIGFIYITQRSKVSSLVKVLENSRETHEEEMNVLQDLHEKEKEEIVKAEARMKEALIKVEEEYKKANKELDSKKRKEVENLIKENKKDPDAITKRISELTGFEIYVE